MRWQEWDTCACTEDEDHPPGCTACEGTGFLLVTLGECERCKKPTVPAGATCVCGDCWPIVEADWLHEALR